MKPSDKLKALFQELISIDTKQTGRRDWSIIKWRHMTPFNQFKLMDLMKVIPVLFLMFMLTGCGTPNVETKPTKYAIGYHNTLELVTIDGCEYLYGDWGNATVLTHKGNCINHKDSIK